MNKNYEFLNFLYQFSEFCSSKNHWSWQELIFGLKNKIIERKDIINYANQILDEEILGFDLVLKIVISDEYEDIIPYLNQLSQLENNESDIFIQDKWRYFILKELYNKKKYYNYDKFNEIVSIIYADFGYPEDMAGFIHYMPAVVGKSIEDCWQEYLANAKNKFET